MILPDIPEVLGPYLVQERLGRGGMGVVYRGAHRETGEYVALKTVSDVKRTRLRSLRREISALTELDHPGAVRVLDSGVQDDLPWYAMELVDGVTLDLYRKKFCSYGPIEPEALVPVLNIAHRIACSLAFLHGEGLVHRDLKPSNILIRSDGSPVLIDFGLAARSGGSGHREILTAAAAAPEGTAAYMSPEQIRSELMDARTDLYSLGCLLYELLTGRPPFLASNQVAVMAGHLMRTPEPPSNLLSWLSPQLDELVLGLLEKEKNLRIGYADFVAASLRDAGARPWDAAETLPRPFLYRPSLAGRGGPMQSLLHAFDRLGAGRTGLLLLGGESGVGKTRLAAEAAQKAHEIQVEVLVGECRSNARHPLAAFRRPLRAISDQAREGGSKEARELLKEHAAILALYGPELAKLTGGFDEETTASRSSTVAVRDSLFIALEEILTAAAGGGGLLLILDDLQWADELTLTFLRKAARGLLLKDSPVLILGTYRSDEVAESLEALLEVAPDPPILLGRLDADAIEEMIGDMLSDRSPPQALVELLRRRSQGNPFFIAEYLEAAVEQGLLRRDHSARWRLAAGGDVSSGTEISLPRALRDLVSSRLLLLSVQERELLDLAAVCGREMAESLVLDIAGLEEIAGDEIFGRLVAKRLFEESGDDRLRFAHDQIREVAYEMIEPARRESLHRLIAEKIRTFREPTPENRVLLADHYFHGRLWEQAARFGEEAGDDAIAVHAHGDARARFGAALKALEHLPEAEESRQARIRLTLKRVTAAWVAEDPFQNLKRLDEARSLVLDGAGFQESEALRILAKIRFWKGRSFFIGNQLRAAERAFRATVKSFDLIEDETMRANAGSLVGRVLNHRGKYRQALVFLEEAQEPLRKPGLEVEWILNSSHLGIALAAQGERSSGVEHARQAVAAADRMSSSLAPAIAHFVLAVVHFILGDTEESLQSSRAAAVASERSEELLLLFLSEALTAWMEIRRGDSKRAAERLTAARRVQRRLGSRLVFSDFFAVAEAETALSAERWEYARKSAIKAVSSAKEVGCTHSEGMARRIWGVAEIKCDPNAFEAAIAHLDLSRTVLESGNAIIEIARTEVEIGKLWLDRDRPRALEHLRRAEKIFERAGVVEEMRQVRRVSGFA